MEQDLDLGQLIYDLRTEAGLSQRELAERMGTTKSVISRIESGQHRSGTDTLRRLAEALDGSAVIGFEFNTGRSAPPDLVRLLVDPYQFRRGGTA